jgi:hypothetical protein
MGWQRALVPPTRSATRLAWRAQMSQAQTSLSPRRGLLLRLMSARAVQRAYCMRRAARWRRRWRRASRPMSAGVGDLLAMWGAEAS